MSILSGIEQVRWWGRQVSIGTYIAGLFGLGALAGGTVGVEIVNVVLTSTGNQPLTPPGGLMAGALDVVMPVAEAAPTYVTDVAPHVIAAGAGAAAAGLTVMAVPESMRV